MIYIHFFLVMSIVGGLFALGCLLSDYKIDRRKERMTRGNHRWWNANG